LQRSHYTKRFTWASHLVLGAALGIAPVAGWIAIRGDLEVTPLVLGVAVLLWVAGFDIFSALQDAEFDREAGLCSLPARLGWARSMALARRLHLAPD
jgi:4-hydroxybenzoate polyprenyltransferase